MSAPRRLNWGCGSHIAPGWVNSDIKDDPGVDVVCDILGRLPLDDESIDYAVSVHALPELPYPQLVPVLEELRRVLKPGGTLRLCLPDLERGIRAYQAGDADYFKVGADEVESLGGRFIVHMLWYGYSRTLFTTDFAEELLRKAGFEDVVACSYKSTASGLAGIVELDNREDESLFVEGTKPIYTAGMPRNEWIKVLDVSVDTGDTDVLRAARLDAPVVGEKVDSSALKIVGWAVGRDAAAEAVEVVAAGQVVATTPLDIERPGVAEAYAQVPGADKAGFRLLVKGSGRGRHDLAVRAILADGVKAPIGTIKVEVGRQSLVDRFLAR